ncbi:HAD domain-containing protein [Nocardioides ultimimeridianus]
MNAQPTELQAATDLPPIAVVLDIDGVIAPIGGPTVWGDDVTLGDPEHGLVLSPAMCAAVDKLDGLAHAGCYWLTDWTQRMRRDRDLLPGRDWPEIADSQSGPARAEQWAGEWWSALPWWKWWVVDEWLSIHPEIQRLVWIDDHLQRHQAPAQAEASLARRAWTIETALRAGAGVDALLLAPDKHTGLRPLDLQIVGDCILGVR